MTFWITDESKEWVDAAESETGQAADAVWASKLLSDDLMRWSRWWLGLGAFILACAAGTVPGPLIAELIINPPGDAGTVAVSIAVTVLAALALAALATVLWRLHRSGRRVARALRWWLTLRSGVVPNQGFAGWVAPRAAMFNPPVFVRIMTAAFAGLFALFAFTAVGLAITEDPAFVVPSVVWSVLGTACCIGQMGGVMRLVNGLAEGDPLWNRVRGR